jgi:glucose-6-phosphate 1-dehydrogenase
MTNASRSDALVLFGVTGDLAKKKLFPALYGLAEQGRLDLPVIGVARSEWDDEHFGDRVEDAVSQAVREPDAAVLRQLRERLTMVVGDYQSPAMFRELRDRLDGLGAQRPTMYLAIPPDLFPTVIEGIAGVGLSSSGRVVVEKPFGRDYESAVALNAVLRAHFAESDIYRIDHFLGKEAVEGLLVFRFGNSVFEPVWNRNYIDHVQITMAESFDVAGRGGFYDGVGALRDVVQNHLFQVVALLAMEPPVSPAADALRDEKVKVFRAMRPLDPQSVVRGQYVGYRNEPGVATDSRTETFLAARLEIDSWRWSGVPFYLRAGKALAKTALEAIVEFKAPPRMLFAEPGDSEPHANLIRFRLGADDGVTITLHAKRPGQRLATHPVELSVDFEAVLGDRDESYERLLGDALAGNSRRFAREDGVLRAWQVVQPVLDEPGPVVEYRKGTWGPREADALPGGDHWHPPDAGE